MVTRKSLQPYTCHSKWKSVQTPHFLTELKNFQDPVLCGILSWHHFSMVDFVDGAETLRSVHRIFHVKKAEFVGRDIVNLVEPTSCWSLAIWLLPRRLKHGSVSLQTKWWCDKGRKKHAKFSSSWSRVAWEPHSSHHKKHLMSKWTQGPDMKNDQGRDV